MAKTVLIEYFVNAPKALVFKALTEAEDIISWCGSKGKVESRIGGVFEMFDGWARGIVKEYVPSSCLAFTWKITDWKRTTTASLVEYELKEYNGGTTIRLRHTNFPNELEAESHEQGWYDYVLNPLKNWVEKRGINEPCLA